MIYTHLYQWEFIVKNLLGPFPPPVVQLFLGVGKETLLTPGAVARVMSAHLYLAYIHPAQVVC